MYFIILNLIKSPRYTFINIKYYHNYNNSLSFDLINCFKTLFCNFTLVQLFIIIILIKDFISSFLSSKG